MIRPVCGLPLKRRSPAQSSPVQPSPAQSNPTAYVGQHLSVIVGGVSTPYQIKNEAGELEPLGAAAVNAASDSEVEEMFDEVFGAE